MNPIMCYIPQQQMHLSESTSTTVPSSAQSVDAEDAAEQKNEKLSFAGGDGSAWYYVDLLEWMGDIMSSAWGRIDCPNPRCQ